MAGGEAYFRSRDRQTPHELLLRTQTALSRGGLSELTAREREVLDLIAQGYNNTQIAARLYVSPKTVRNHIAHIFTKLQVADRAHANPGA